MYTFNENINEKEYNEFVKNFPMASFMQEYNWCKVKNNWGSLHCGLYKDGILVGVCSILIKKIIKKINLFYIPRGYLIDFTNYEDLKQMTENIKTLAKKNNAYVVKIDPNFCISDDSFKDENVEHNYSKDYTIKHKNLLKLGYKYNGTSKELHKNLQPQYNIFASMCDSDSNILTEEQILKTYKSKIRYYLGNFHKKRGITFEFTDDINRLDEFMNLLKITEEKQNIKLRNKEYFKRIMENYKGQAFLAFGKIDLNNYLNFLKEEEDKNSESIKSTKELIDKFGSSMTLSASLVLLPKNEIGIRTSEYLYTGNNSFFNNLHVSHGLVFEIIKFSIKNNCHYCNLGGVDGNLDDRLTKFKQNFNSRIMEFAGEYDLPINWMYKPIKIFYPFLKKIYKKIKS